MGEAGVVRVTLAVSKAHVCMPDSRLIALLAGRLLRTHLV